METDWFPFLYTMIAFEQKNSKKVKSRASD